MFTPLDATHQAIIIAAAATDDASGIIGAIEAAGIVIENNSIGGWQVFGPGTTATAAQAIVSAYTNSATQLNFWKARKQATLDAEFDANFDLAKFIRGGTATGITAAQVGNFLATITNNYRTLRASIAAATTVAQVQAISIASGWPNNP